ncbi:MAG: orotidine 5'-phosphate decarboxylase [Planctomycetaceae bacterium]|nr:MAG: orotidine 5'-phosphate decarboxylase [Planctomycetaceae bacterium]
MADFSLRLETAIRRCRTPSLVGLDPRWDWLPDEIKTRKQAQYSDILQAKASAYEEFCLRIIDIVAAWVPAIKPQAAFFEACGPAGSWALHRVMLAARQRGLIVICDAKRGDIGSTAEAYAQAYLAGEDPACAPWPADALTVNPFLGPDTLQPFLDTAHQRGGGVFILVRTSNPAAHEYQDHRAESGTLSERIAQDVERWAEQTAHRRRYGCVGGVVGATYPAELSALRQLMPHAWLLLPGYGSQGGTAADVATAFDEFGLGALVNNARGINFAWRVDPWKDRFSPAEWEQAVEAATRHMVAELARVTPGLNRQ